MKLRLAAVVALELAAGPAFAQEPKIMGTPLVQREIKQRMDIEGGKREVILGQVDMAPGAAVGRHIHPGPEMGYVVTGQLTLKVAGRPDRHLVPGQSYTIPAGVAHDAVSDRDNPKGVEVTAVWVLDKGKAFSSPAP
jgi:quercetin dioxygenase-like cupin family protein